MREGRARLARAESTPILTKGVAELDLRRSPELVRGMPRFSIMRWRLLDMRRSFRVTLLAAALNIVGMAIDLIFWGTKCTPPLPGTSCRWR